MLPRASLTRIAQRFKREQIAFFGGSAISIWAPSNLPSAQDLREAIVASLARTSGLAGDIDSALRSLLMAGPPRLEAVLEELYECFGSFAFRYLYVLRSDQPNPMHHFLAEGFRTRRIPVIYTTNQDMLIEEALKHLGWLAGKDYQLYDGISLPNNDSARAREQRIYHLHGTVALDRDESIRATLRQVGNALDHRFREALLRDLARYPFCFIGYSGQDIDIRPVLLQAQLVEAFWLDLPGAFTSTHTAMILKDLGKKVELCEVDLQHFLLPFGGKKLRFGNSGHGIDKYLFQLSSGLNPGLKVHVISRCLRKTHDPEKERKREKYRSLAMSLSRDPSVAWRCHYDRAEVHLHNAVWFLGDLVALWYYMRASREASLASEPSGVILSIRGAGQSIDLLLCGMVPLSSFIAMRLFYRKAASLIAGIHLIDSFEREYLNATVQLLLARACFKLGRYSEAKERFESILRKHGGSSLLKGHALRFLACIDALEGHLPAANKRIDEAISQFRFIENQIEEADAVRDRGICYFLCEDLHSAAAMAEEARSRYERVANRRGLVKIQTFKLLITLTRLLKRVSRSRISEKSGALRRLVLAV